MEDVLILYTTWPDAETAAAFGRLAVERRLAACANLLAPMRSIYAWEGAVQDEAETPMLLKTSAAAGPELLALLLDRHPYETPCALALPVDAARSAPGYVSWLLSSAPPPAKVALT